MTSSPKKDRPAFILASASPRRKTLFQLFDIPFTVKPSRVDEHIAPDTSPETAVQKLALRKARNIASSTSNAIILGADTIVVHNDKILGKPDNHDHAEALLHSLSNSSHQVLTGVALIRTHKNGSLVQEDCFVESTRVTFGALDPDAIKQYVAGGGPMDKAGAYGIQDDWGAVFVKRIEGDYYNIVGLPLHALYKRLKEFAPELFSEAD